MKTWPRIESVANQRVVDLERKVRRGEIMLVEGEKLISEALRAGSRLDSVFSTEDSLDSEVLSEADREGVEIVWVSGRILEKLTELRESRGLIALAPVPEMLPLEVLPESSPLVLGLDGVQDPANVGVILRSFLAFGGKEVILLPGTASPFSAKAIRSSAGAVFHLLFFRLDASSDVATLAGENGRTLLGLSAHQGEPPSGHRIHDSAILFVGSEGHGLSRDTEDCLHAFVRIPMPGGTESLNAAVAASIVLYELSRETLD